MSNLGFREIADDLRTSISGGTFGESGSVPSESELEERYRVSRTTVRRALALLEDEDLIEAVPGRGRFVKTGDGSSEVARTDKKYEQVIEELRREIAEDKNSGDRLGTVEEFAGRFAVSTGTVRRALLVLEEKGLVTSVQGHGWYAGSLAGESNRTGTVVARLREAISTGRVGAGSSLPGEKALAAEYGVARITIRRALAVLEAEGLLENRPGLGRRVLGKEDSQRP